MRLLQKVTIPHEPFNSMVRKGTAGETIGRILSELKPEAVYFTEMGGKRTAIVIADYADASKIPGMAEPWFLSFGADVEQHIVMSPEDLAKAGLETIGKAW